MNLTSRPTTALSRNDFPGEGNKPRARIMAVAEALFIHHGFVQTSIEAIVREAATSKREFYRHFKDKESLFLDVVEHLLRISNTTASIPEGELEDALKEIAERTYVSHLHDRSLGLYRASIAASMFFPKLAPTVYQSRARAAEPVARYFERCRDTHALTFDDSFLAALRFGFFAIDGLRYAMGAPTITKRKQKKHAAEVSRLFLNGHVTSKFRMHPEQVLAGLDGVLKLTSGEHTWKPTSLTPTRRDSAEWHLAMEHAWSVFREQGYAGTSISAVARETGLARTTIYRHYPDKEAFFTAVATQVIDRCFDLRLTVDWHRSSIQATLRHICSAILDRYLLEDNLNLQKILLVAGSSDPAVSHGVYEHMINRVFVLLEPLLGQLANAGLIAGDNLLQTSRRLFVLTTFGGRFLYVTPSSRRERNALVREAVDLFLYGCRRP